ncbi:MAG: hypothetical protein H7A40_04425 [Chlamydiales bacterium]|nr:hypothetical protein [Chlamydiales bacterium]
MRRVSYRSYFILGASLIIALCLPKQTCQSLRASSVALSSPIWKSCGLCRAILFAGPCAQKYSDGDYERLQIENDRLRCQIDRICKWLEQQEHLDSIGAAQADATASKFTQSLKSTLDATSQFALARVVFREPASWSQFIWIDVGETTNFSLGTKLVCKNSPVVVGSALIGVVETVGKHRSCVRLITDGTLCPSVRAVRGGLQGQVLLDHLEGMMKQMPLQKHLLGDEYSQVCQMIAKVKARIGTAGEIGYAAKGFLQGCSAPLWRCRNQKLKGYGFQWDFADSEGPPREIESGKALDLQSKIDPVELLRVGDVLVTTGFDGVFPPHLKVATVSKIYPLIKGAPTYSIEAEMIASNLHDLEFVQVLPPMETE